MRLTQGGVTKKTVSTGRRSAPALVGSLPSSLSAGPSGESASALPPYLQPVGIEASVAVNASTAKTFLLTALRRGSAPMADGAMTSDRCSSRLAHRVCGVSRQPIEALGSKRPGDGLLLRRRLRVSATVFVGHPLASLCLACSGSRAWRVASRASCTRDMTHVV